MGIPGDATHDSIGLASPRRWWHAPRRVFAAHLLDQDAPLERIRDRMGHSTIRVAETHAYSMPETLAHDIRAIDSALE